MKLNDALAKGNRVCVALKDDTREIGCYMLFTEVNKLTTMLNVIVGDVVETQHKDYEFIKVLYISEVKFDDLFANEFVRGQA